MGQQYSSLNAKLTTFIEDQKVFFVGTAAAKGRVSVSPKGMDTFRVLSPDSAVWLNITGSGNETAAHLLQLPRMTIMFCSFEGKPNILRLYGQATAYHPRDDQYRKYISLFPKIEGGRQIIEMKIDLVTTACGFGVPLMDFRKERADLADWAEKQGPEKLERYKQEKNARSIDGFETGIDG